MSDRDSSRSRRRRHGSWLAAGLLLVVLGVVGEFAYQIHYEFTDGCDGYLPEPPCTVGLETAWPAYLVGATGAVIACGSVVMMVRRRRR